MRAILRAAALAALCGAAAAGVEQEVVAIERQAMEGWLKGDAGPALAHLDTSVTLFHIVTEGRVDGLAAVKALYEGYGGRPLFDSYEIASPKVQVAGETAVLTYLLVTRNGELTRRWNATNVYQKKPGGWRAIHSHFSQSRPPAN
jgi:hypothetical protein